MGSNLYFLADGRAVEMAESVYETENQLQELIANNPRLLLRDSSQTDAKLMLIARELTVAEGEESDNAYFLDHLFVDESGTPVLVEVKRSTDTRIRREVVAQMLDYASRASAWDVNELRAMFRESNQGSDLLDEYDTDDFWEQVATCLKAERIKLVFVADKIPNTLKTLIEFLDRSMSSIDVYGVEIHRYKTAGATMLASSVIGKTQVKRRTATYQRGNAWTVDRFSSYLLGVKEDDIEPVFREICAYAEELGLTLKYGFGPKVPTIIFGHSGKRIFSLSYWWKKAQGHICTAEFCVKDLLLRLPLNQWDEDTLRKHLSNIPGQADAEMFGLLWNTDENLYIDLRPLRDEANLSYFKQAVASLCDELVEPDKNILVSPIS